MDTLISFDTQNGTGDELACLAFLHRTLESFRPDRCIFETVKRSRNKSDSGFVLAIWGQPKVVLNVHMDTVPVAAGWKTDPHKMVQTDDRIFGLGSSDIKGAGACILAAMQVTPPKDVAILFSGDEEHGSEVMPEVIKRGHLAEIRRAIVCEPTCCKPGRRHRGMLAFSVKFTGKGGHSSLADHTERPFLDIARFAAQIGEYGDRYKDFGTAPYKGLCTNIGIIEGDGAYNVIPTLAQMKFSMRPPPSDNVGQREADIRDIYSQLGFQKTTPSGLDRLVALEPFECLDFTAMQPFFPAMKAVDLPYWTEAALLSAAGLNAVVYGPGDVEQAHKPNEFVLTAQLVEAAAIYQRALSGGIDL